MTDITVPMPVKGEGGQVVAWLIRKPRSGALVRLSDFHFVGEAPVRGDPISVEIWRFIKNINEKLKAGDKANA